MASDLDSSWIGAWTGKSSSPGSQSRRPPGPSWSSRGCKCGGSAPGRRRGPCSADRSRAFEWSALRGRWAPAWWRWRSTRCWRGGSCDCKRVTLVTRVWPTSACWWLLTWSGKGPSGSWQQGSQGIGRIGWLPDRVSLPCSPSIDWGLLKGLSCDVVPDQTLSDRCLRSQCSHR